METGQRQKPIFYLYFLYVTIKEKKNIGHLTDKTGMLNQDSRRMACLYINLATLCSVKNTMPAPEDTFLTSEITSQKINIIDKQDVQKYLDK